MSWLKLDDRFLRHPKFLDAMARHVHALYAWLGLLSWCKQNLTDGIVPAAATRVTDGPSNGKQRALAFQALIDAGLVHREASGDLRLHDYLSWNEPAHIVKAKRAADADRKRGGISRPATPPSTSDSRLTLSRLSPDNRLTPVEAAVDSIQSSTNSGPCTQIPDGFQPSESETETETMDRKGSSGLPAAPTDHSPAAFRLEPISSESTLAAKSDKGDPARASKSADVERVFNHWRTRLDHPRAKLEDNRRRLILARLRDFTADELCEAIDGCAKSDWHMGRDPQTGGKRYDSIELIMRNAGKVEWFQRIASDKATATSHKPSGPRRFGSAQRDEGINGFSFFKKSEGGSP